MSPAKPCGSFPNWEGAPIQGVFSIPYATGLCVCSKSRYLNRVCGFVFLICTLTLRGEHFVHPFVFSISLVMGVANRDGARLFFIPFSPKCCNVAMLQCCRAFSMSARRRANYLFWYELLWWNFQFLIISESRVSIYKRLYIYNNLIVTIYLSDKIFNL